VAGRSLAPVIAPHWRPSPVPGLSRRRACGRSCTTGERARGCSRLLSRLQTLGASARRRSATQARAAFGIPHRGSRSRGPSVDGPRRRSGHGCFGTPRRTQLRGMARRVPWDLGDRIGDTRSVATLWVEDQRPAVTIPDNARVAAVNARRRPLGSQWRKPRKETAFVHADRASSFTFRGSCRSVGDSAPGRTQGKSKRR